MYNRNLEKLTPICMKIIYKLSNDNEKDMKKNGGLKKDFNGYFASFGPSVIMAGLNQTVSFYADTSKKSKQGYVNTIIWDVLKEMNWAENENSLTNYVKNRNILRKDRILEVVTACKLAIRTFDLKE